ncbi:MAG: hypothetical protein KGJ59_09280 [Bacteroidota bacterium]|nr:hypothetical protein [Bacteroidota bacterium]
MFHGIANFVAFVLLFVANGKALAGPPFVTDDPEPVELHHWEVYVASQPAHDKGGWSGTCPHFELNYGAVKNLQLHLIVPLAFEFPVHGTKEYGVGDTELGAKYRFVDESDNIPQIGSFPLVEIPTGNEARGLGSGHVQTFAPLWLQKSFGSWMTYGGAGYWFNPGTGNRNWVFVGAEIQNQIRDNAAIGVEVFHSTPQDVVADSETRFNIGAMIDFSETQHLLLSAGTSLNGSGGVHAYLAYQLTLGPEN